MLHAIVSIAIGVVVVAILREFVLSILSHFPSMRWLYDLIKYGNLFLLALGVWFGLMLLWGIIAFLALLFDGAFLVAFGVLIVDVILLILTVGAFAWCHSIAEEEKAHPDPADEDDEDEEEDDEESADDDEDDQFQGVLKNLDAIKKVKDPQEGDTYATMDNDSIYMFKKGKWVKNQAMTREYRKNLGK